MVSYPTTSNEIVVGVIPREEGYEDRDVDPKEAEIPHEEGYEDRDVDPKEAGQDTLVEIPQWPKPNEEQEVRVYKRRQRTERDQVQGPDLEVQGQLDAHDLNLSPSEGDDTLACPHDDLDVPIAFRKQARTTAGKVPLKLSSYDISNYVSYISVGPQYKSFLSSLESAAPIPCDWQEAKQDPRWRQAMLEEMAALDKNNTWVLTTLPANKKAVGCKWVFTVKQNSEGKVERYKARLVAKGYSQTYGIDYDETFAPVAKMNTIRTLISIAANFKWKLFQMDVKNAFLHGDLLEEVYMEIPPGFSSQETKGKVCRLKKSLYGLKQSPRAWFGKFRKELRLLGYKQSNADHTLFFKHYNGKIVILIVYVDDIVITGNDDKGISNLKKMLSRSFEVKDLGFLHYFLGIEVVYGALGIYLSQRKYVLDLLAETGMLESKPAATPIEQNLRMTATSGNLLIGEDIKGWWDD